MHGRLGRAGLHPLFTWVITSVDAGARKPAPQFFEYAVARCAITAQDVLFVGNQLNTDVARRGPLGIRTVWLSDPEYRSADDTPRNTTPSHSIAMLYELPALLQGLDWG